MIYIAKPIEIKATDGFLLPGLFFEPKHKTKKAVIALHGNGSSSVFYPIARTAEYAKYFTEQGISYLGFNNRGSGYVTKIRKLSKGVEVQKRAGTAYELIKDCVHDIDGAVNFFTKLGYTELYLVGFSTGANKVCVYNHYKPKNKITKYVLVCGGDDSGVFYRTLGKSTFLKLLSTAKEKVRNRKGEELVPGGVLGSTYSYQSIYDTINPDGNYNTFPFTDYFGKLGLSKKKLFRYYASIVKPTLVVYGEHDEYCYGRVPDILKVLQEKSAQSNLNAYVVIPGANHGFTNKTRNLFSAITRWL
jgi:pimeloyl-ACP methyl ester carboxylesterase